MILGDFGTSYCKFLEFDGLASRTPTIVPASELPADVSQRVFERFWQADSSRGATGKHAGLGLSLCREVARVLGGNLAIDTKNGVFIAELRFHQQGS